MAKRLFAFDLDGTLLTTEKELTAANRRALHEMAACGDIVALASGRLGSSVRMVQNALGLDTALLTLNGAAVYMRNAENNRQVHSAPLPRTYADALVEYAAQADFALNYYYDNRLYAVRNDKTAPWLDLYYGQTRTEYVFVDTLMQLNGCSPHKIIFVGDPQLLDREEEAFRKKWGLELYICRTWDYYLEFLNPEADKGAGIEALARAYRIPLEQVVAFGDADNDVPMLHKAGLGIVMKNGTPMARAAAGYVSQWTNDEDGIAREWERIRCGDVAVGG